MARATTDVRDAGTPADEARATEETDSAAGSIRVGVLSPHNSKETKAILNAVRALGHDPVWIRDENVASWIEDGEVRLTPRVDILINRLLLTKSDRQIEDLQLAGIYAERVPVLNPPRAVRNAIHKYRAGVRLAEAGLPVPEAFFGRTPQTFGAWPERRWEAAVQKRTIGTNGQHMAIVSPDQPLEPFIENEQSFVQEYLDDGVDRPTDMRVYVVGEQVVGAMRRRAPEGDWRTNVAVGGETMDVTADLGEYPRRIAREATAVLGLDIAGVDLMAVDGEWFILEVNATAGFKGLFAASGTSVAPHIARLAIHRAGGCVADERVAALEGILDDSVPSCKPPRGRRRGTSAVLGYTTEILVSGDDATEAVLAKSDTGAERTSLDTALAERVGVGEAVGSTRVRSATGEAVERRPLVEVDLRLNGDWRCVTANVTDRSRMNYPVLLGRDVLGEYRLDVSKRAEE